ncbi:helix-turn-helix domain-containing protein [Caenimonas sp. SL110]|uniref:helix-turn-helix domain-containing protein n=1 Tax=Caenimonas sp. SL110 TaxID=1450524 RepID=UPI000654469D|nr:helix-turn-helix domain-containing protein [Caenimonas sp. SL110]
MTHIQPILTPSQLGVQLQGARKSQKLTQAQLAARLDISQNRLSDLERNPGTLNVDQLLALCNQLGLQLALQVADDTKPTPTRAQW